MSNPAFWLLHGQEFPYDSEECFDGEVPLPSVSWQRAAALAVLSNLGDRRGIKHELHNIDMDVRQEIVETLSKIIELAHGMRGKGK
jgi:hypothetical protein